MTLPYTYIHIDFNTPKINHCVWIYLKSSMNLDLATKFQHKKVINIRIFNFMEIDTRVIFFL